MIVKTPHQFRVMLLETNSWSDTPLCFKHQLFVLYYIKSNR